MGYVTETEIEGLFGRSITTSTPVTTAILATMITEYSNKIDGLTGVDSGTYGDDSTAPQWVKEAVKTAIVMKLESLYVENVYFSDKDITMAMRNFIAKQDRQSSLTTKFVTHSPDIQGK